MRHKILPYYAKCVWCAVIFLQLFGVRETRAAVSDGFDYPVGKPYRTQASDSDGWYVLLDFNKYDSDLGGYSYGEDWNTNVSEADCNAPAYAVSNGTVYFAGWDSLWGNVVIIRHQTPSGSMVESFYGRLNSISKWSGNVSRGEEIGRIGKTGVSMFPYCRLHFEIRLPECAYWGRGTPSNVSAFPPNKDEVGWHDPSSWIDANRTFPAGLLSKPTLLSPSNNSTILNYTPPAARFAWTAATGSPTGYDIEFDDDPGFGAPIKYTSATTQFDLPAPFSPLGNYYRRVRATKGAQKGPWSTESWKVNIQTSLPGPDLLDPNQGEIWPSGSVDFDWSNVGGNFGYRLQIAADAAFTQLEATPGPTATNDSDLTVSGISSGLHYWRVYTLASGGTNAGVSLTRSFTVNDPNAPQPPILSSPSDNTTVASCVAEFSWNPISGATYRLQVSPNASFSTFSPGVNTLTGSATTHEATGLPSGTYYWRVNATKLGSTSAWSSPARRFTLNTSAAPAAPALSASNPLPIETQSSFDFQWTPNGASSYDLQVANASGSNTYVNLTGLGGSSATPAFAFSPTSYQWRMRSRQGSQIGCWGSWVPFSVTLPPVPGAPIPVAPLGSDIQNESSAVTFQWTPQGPAATKFEVWVFKNGSKVRERMTTNSTPNTSIAGLIAGEYTWSVRGYNALNNPGNWSVSTAFRVKSPYEISLGNEAPNQAYNADPINTASGNYTFNRTDLLIPAVGFPFEFTRNYNSRDSRITGPMGAKWTHSYETRLVVIDPQTVKIAMADGGSNFFSYDSTTQTYTQLYTPSSGTLRNMPTGYRFTTKSLVNYDFDPAGKLVSISDRNNNTLTLTYAIGTGYLQSITDTSGRVYTFSTDFLGRITQLTDPLLRTVVYEYNLAGDLIKVTNPRSEETDYAYEPGTHNLEVVTDARGNDLITNVYDAQGRVTSQQNARNFTTTFSYDDVNNLTIATDPLSKTTEYQYDLGLRLVSVKDRRGFTTQFTYDANNNRTAITDAMGRSTKFTYDASGNVLTITNAKDEKTSMSWTATNQIAAIQDPLNRVTRFTYDSQSNLIGIGAPMGANTTLNRDSRGLVESSTNPRGAVTQFSYDATPGSVGDLIQTIDALSRITSYEYDAVGRLTKIIEPGDTPAEQAETEFVYDLNDNLIEVEDALDKSAIFHFDANDNLTSSTTRRGNIWRTAYNEHDMPEVKTDPLNNTIQYIYDELDRVSQMIDQRGKIWQFTYDAEGHLLTSTDPTSSTLTRTYDPVGNLASVKNSNNHETEFFYDSLNRLVTTTDPLFNASSIEYDPAGRISKLIDAMDRETLLTYDDLDRMIKVTDPNLGTVEYGYDAVGNRTSVRDPRGNVSLFIYDQINRLTKVIDPLNRATEYTYDTPGNRQTRLDARTITTTYVYDLNHRLTGINYSDSTPDVTPITYDDDGNRLSAAVAGLGAQSYAYDTLGRLDAYTDVFSRTLDYEYDAASNRTRIVYPGPLNVDYAYDDAGRLDSVTDWTSDTLAYSYDPAGNLIQTDYPNGAQETRAYDAAERVAQIHHLNGSGGTLAKMDFIYDDVGNIIIIDREDAALRKFAQEQTDYHYDAANQMVETAGQAQDFDDAGNQTLVKRADGTQLNLTYDAENRVTQIVGPSGTANLSYDANGLRVRSMAGAATVRHLWDVNAGLPIPVVEDDGTNPVARDLYGLMAYARRTAPTDAIQSLHADQVGSVLAVTNDAGALAFGAAYDEFGERTGASGTAANAYGFWGAYGVPVENEELLYARARFLDPIGGRFLGEDSILAVDTSSQHLHRYVQTLNNSLRFTDASGLSPVEAGLPMQWHTAGTTPMFLPNSQPRQPRIHFSPFGLRIYGQNGGPGYSGGGFASVTPQFRTGDQIDDLFGGHDVVYGEFGFFSVEALGADMVLLERLHDLDPQTLKETAALPIFNAYFTAQRNIRFSLLVLHEIGDTINPLYDN